MYCIFVGSAHICENFVKICIFHDERDNSLSLGLSVRNLQTLQYSRMGNHFIPKLEENIEKQAIHAVNRAY